MTEANEPLVTVVIASHNYARLLPDALDSLQHSNYQRWQCVVVDDGSTDDTEAVVERFAAEDERIACIRKQGGGMVSCFNAAEPLVEGEFVALLDADDLVLPDRLRAIAARFIEHPHAGLVVHRLAVTDSALRLVGVLPLARQLPEGDLSSVVLSGRTGIIGAGVTSNMALRADAYRSIFPADPEIGNYPDALIRRLAPLDGEVASIDRVLGVRRLHALNDSRIDSVSFVEHVRRAAQNGEAMEAEIERGLQRRGISAAGERDEDYATLSHSYALARLCRSPDADEAESRFFRSDAFANLPPLHRAYWHTVRRVPHRLVQPALGLLYAPDGLKPLLQHARLRLSGRRWRDDLRDLRHAPLSSVIRHTVDGRW